MLFNVLNGNPPSSLEASFPLCVHQQRAVLCTRYGIRIRVAGMKILSPRPLDEPSFLLTESSCLTILIILH